MLGQVTQSVCGHVTHTVYGQPCHPFGLCALRRIVSWHGKALSLPIFPCNAAPLKVEIFHLCPGDTGMQQAEHVVGRLVEKITAAWICMLSPSMEPIYMG